MVRFVKYGLSCPNNSALAAGLVATLVEIDAATISHSIYWRLSGVTAKFTSLKEIRALRPIQFS